MILYNSLGDKREEFIPNEKGKVKMYTCGPTVYYFAHIGNLRTYIYEDILEKTLLYLGYDVKRAMNITDVGHLESDADEGEDKMLKGALREHKSILEIAQFYTEAFKNDFKKLNLKWPDIVVPATSMIDEYIKMIQKLIDTGYAYFSDGNIYFDTSKLKNYYTLVKQSNEDLMVGVRDDVEEDVNKKHPQDFVLWFTKSKFEAQALKWDSPWGVGYPGWHIECSAISLKYLGEYLDIHCGGIDNKFPHHTNEIAQSESYLGHKWCNYWFHPRHLNMSDGKMSKSSGKFVTIDDLINKGYNPLAYKYFCLQSHYLKNLVFSYENLDIAKNAYEKLIKKIQALKEDGQIENDKMENYRKTFKDALENNLNTPMALTVVYDTLKSDMTDASKLALIEEFDGVLGLGLTAKEDKVDEVPEELLKLLNERTEARRNKDYKKSDELRDLILSKGYKVVDNKEGSHLEKI